MTVNKDGGRLPKSVDICVCCQGSAGRKMMEVMVGVTACLNAEGSKINQWIEKQIKCVRHCAKCTILYVSLVLSF